MFYSILKINQLKKKEYFSLKKIEEKRTTYHKSLYLCSVLRNKHKYYRFKKQRK